VTKIAEFEERDLENATEYLKYRLDDKKNHFDVNFYNQELPKERNEIVQSELVKSSWNAKDQPVNWDISYEAVDLKKYGYY